LFCNDTEEHKEICVLLFFFLGLKKKKIKKRKMNITFLGTRGNITARTKKHYRHTSTLFSSKRKHLLIDCGKDWLGRIFKLKPKPHAILITHGHNDHVEGLKNGAPCPVYATQESWLIMKNYAIKDRYLIVPHNVFSIAGFSVEPFMVRHAISAPAVGYRISDTKKTVFYISDLVNIKQEKKALHAVDAYIGDGAIITRPLLVKKKKGTYIGHSPISKQVAWCAKNNVPSAIFTHCGSEIVTGDEQLITEKIESIAQKYAINVQLAYDGMKIKV
jgi:ribonuclease BN (tRNA processing enzyme)